MTIVTQGQLIGVLEVPEYDEELAQASALEKRSQQRARQNHARLSAHHRALQRDRDQAIRRHRCNDSGGTASHTQAKPVVRIAVIDRHRLVLPVPESTISRIHIGGPVEVRVDCLQRVLEYQSGGF